METKEKKKNLFNIEGNTRRPWEYALKADRVGEHSPQTALRGGGGGYTCLLPLLCSLS